MARKSRKPGLTGSHAAFRRGQKVHSIAQYAGEGAGRRSTPRGSRRIVKPARRTARGVRAFVSAVHPRAANGRFRRR